MWWKKCSLQYGHWCKWHRYNIHMTIPWQHVNHCNGCIILFGDHMFNSCTKKPCPTRFVTCLLLCNRVMHFWMHFKHKMNIYFSWNSLSWSWQKWGWKLSIYFSLYFTPRFDFKVWFSNCLKMKGTKDYVPIMSPPLNYPQMVFIYPWFCYNILANLVKKKIKYTNLKLDKARKKMKNP
jgi:hypothetical protein